MEWGLTMMIPWWCFRGGKWVEVLTLFLVMRDRCLKIVYMEWGLARMIP
jgi:hypothetical protein